MSFVYFLLGLISGVLGYHLWSQNSQPKPNEDNELRLQALEEQLAFILTRLEETEQKEPRPTRAKKSVTQALGNKQEQILELETQGYDPQAIARELNIPLGQVELVMRLFRKGRT